ncbi:hypothetical protein V6N13_127297 [Hibiscus sabdariffa]|uniref:Uncharacterized protein n=1 Tax=Hibiscus sabdariffa TaxID=183260 RepID=A0ABR2RD13_9ROSI
MKWLTTVRHNRFPVLLRWLNFSSLKDKLSKNLQSIMGWIRMGQKSEFGWYVSSGHDLQGFADEMIVWIYSLDKNNIDPRLIRANHVLNHGSRNKMFKFLPLKNV